MRPQILTRSTRGAWRHIVAGTWLGIAAMLVTTCPVWAADCDGIADNFVCPVEPATPDVQLADMMIAQYADPDCFALLDFDEFPGTWDCSGNDLIPATAMLIHRMTFTPPGAGLQGAILTVHAKAAPAGHGQIDGDFIAFFEGTTYITGANIRKLSEANGTWIHDQEATFSLALSNLPTGGPGSGLFELNDIIQYLLDGDLDIMIGDETAVDWVCLEFVYCVCICHGDPQCDGVSNVQDVVKTVDVAFRGASPVQDPTCPKQRTDVDCDNVTTVIDVVKAVNVAFRGANPATVFCDPCAP